MNAPQVTLDVSSACNFRCTYCATSGRCEEQGEPMDVPSALDRLRAEGYGVVVFSGGEPLIHAELCDWLSHARALGFTQRTIVTNGSRLGTPGLVERLVGAGLTHVNVSFHTCRPSVFDALAGVPKAFERVAHGIETLVAVNARLGRPLFVHTNLLLMRQTADHVAETIHFVADKGIDRVTIEVVRARGGVVGREDVFRCRASELARAMDAATQEAARLGVTLNTADIPACLSGSPERFDISSFVVRREKEVHWVVSARSEGRLNRDTHVKPDSCADCAFDPWCTGFERTLLASSAEPGTGTSGAGARLVAPTRLEDGADLPPPVRASVLLDAQAALQSSHAGGTIGADERTVRAARDVASRSLDVCSLLAPPGADTTAAWLRLYEAYARSLLPPSVGDRAAASEALGLFPPPAVRARHADARAVTRRVESLARREAVIEGTLATIASELAAAPCEPPACCARAAPTDGEPLALPWLQSIVRGATSPWLCSALLPELLPYVWCCRDCPASHALAEQRLRALAEPVRRAALQLLSARVLALGPWVRIVLGRARGGDPSGGYDPGSIVVLSDPTLPRAARDVLLRAVGGIVVPLLLDGDCLVEQPGAIVVRREGRDLTELPRKLRWAGALCRHDAVSP